MYRSVFDWVNKVITIACMIIIPLAIWKVVDVINWIIRRF